MTLKELATELYRNSNGHFNGYRKVSIRWLMAYIQAMTRTETGECALTMETKQNAAFTYVHIKRREDEYSYEFSREF